MYHNGNAVGFGGAIDDLQLFHTVQIIIGVKQLVGRVDFDHPDAEAHNLLHICENVGRVPRMQAATRNQALRTFFDIVGDELIDFSCEPHDLRSNIIDEHSTADTDGIQVLEKVFGRTAELNHLIEVRTFLFKSLERPGFEHLQGLNVDVAVGNQI